jgi:di/tricarboxylate transporter
MLQQTIVYIVLAVTLVLFFYGRWRYDVVALLSLLALTIFDIVPPKDAFLGFGHPAVITVAAVMVVSRGFENSGLVELIVNFIMKLNAGQTVHILLLTSLIAILSAFMNNICAIAILLPVGISIAKKNEFPVSNLLMPLAFGSILGGMVTLIGTPPNIIIANFREEVVGQPFQIFDFSHVGLIVCALGVLFVALIGWRLIPHRKGLLSQDELFDIEKYLTELQIAAKSSLEGKTIQQMEKSIANDLNVLGIIRKNDRINNPSQYEELKKGDILLIETDSEGIKQLTDLKGVKLVSDTKIGMELLKSDEIMMTEAVVTPRSGIRNRKAANLNLWARFGVHLLAVAREGARLKDRLNSIVLRTGDILLLRGEEAGVQEAITTLGCLPLAERRLQIGAPNRVIVALAIFAMAIGCAAIGLIPVQIAFIGAATAMYLVKIIKLREIYLNIDWSIIVLIGSMIPVAHAMETTGGADQIAASLLLIGGDSSPAFILTLLLIATMCLTDVINNSAAAVLMAPIAIKLANGLQVSPDPFLMCVAIGASCAFLTPIGHQSNALVMGPGGYRFNDYWKMGLPLEILIVIITIPLLLYFWPLTKVVPLHP